MIEKLELILTNLHDLKGKTVVVIGGAGLLGYAFCDALFKSGANVAIADFDGELASKKCKALSEVDHGRAISIVVDVTSEDSIQALINKVKDKFGQVHAVVNCAYPRNENYGKKFEDVTYNSFCENVSMNLGGSFLLTKLFSELFCLQSFGHFINISSIYGVIAPRFEIYGQTEMTMPVEYAAIKSGVIHLTKYFSRVYKGSNLRFNCISPGGILDGQSEEFISKYNQFGSSKGMLDVEDIAGTVVFLVSDSSQFINGQNLIVDDGWTL